jgi:hypothetical protein
MIQEKISTFSKKVLRFSKKPPKSLINTLHHSDGAKNNRWARLPSDETEHFIT